MPVPHLPRLAPLTLAVAIGCDTASSGPPAFSLTDSAGIAIASNDADPDDDNGPTSTTTVLTIGDASGDETLTFGRIADVAVDSRGRILVLDQLAHAVRVFGADGSFVTSFGRDGEGPGEFTNFANAVMVGAGDTIFVADYANIRISAFDPAGTFVRSIPLPPLPTGHSWALTPGGGFLYRGMTISRDETNRFRFWNAIMRLEPGRAEADTVLLLEYANTDIGGPGNIRVPLIVNSPFWAVTTDGRIVWSATDRREVSVHGADGAPQRLVRSAAWQTAPVTGADRNTMVELLRAKMRMLGGQESVADGPNVEAPDAFPAITGLLAAPDGSVWVQRMGDAEDIDPWAVNAPNRSMWLGGPVWDVVDTEGRIVRQVRLPDRFRPFRILDDRVVGVAKDEVDVERVVVLRVGGS